VVDTKAILKLVTYRQPDMPCFLLLTEANFKTLLAEATTTSPEKIMMGLFFVD
jgi:hypothetical protein